ncbi:beta-1,4-galactosyltransferase 3-like [Mytilus edulis]|uniref:beta-1,4-galactosyltransferase 3-like n=1 Tax=Mytilus edulis TaxID=6550 RepID=UPI0039EEBAC1
MFLASLKKYAFFSVSTIYFAMLFFSLVNYKDHCIFTHPKTLLDFSHKSASEVLDICQPKLENLDVTNIDIVNAFPIPELAEKYPFVKKGGHFSPKDCKSYQKVAIIVPYRDRLHHLKILLNRLHPMLFKQQIEYRIFIIEQSGNDRFNRGKLMNVGFTEALKYENFDCFVFHDADLLPENDKNLYLCDNNVRQLSSAIDEMRYHVMYYNYAGGVVATKKETFVRINGFANSYWGWGNEDDDFSARLQSSGILLTRPPEYIGRFKMVRHKKETRSEHGYEAFLGWRGRWHKDGLNSPKTMNYSVVDKRDEHLYTNITVDLGPSKGHMVNPAEDTTKESTLWFLRFYFP